jgi:hypothetical protein
VIAKVQINEHNAKKNFFFFALPSERTFNEVKRGIAPCSNKREAPAVTNHVQGLMKGGVVPPGL